jgi:hypothetical protein
VDLGKIHEQPISLSAGLYGFLSHLALKGISSQSRQVWTVISQPAMVEAVALKSKVLAVESTRL